MDRICALLLVISFMVYITPVQAQSDSIQAKSTEIEEGAAQVWQRNKDKIVIKKAPRQSITYSFRKIESSPGEKIDPHFFSRKQHRKLTPRLKKHGKLSFRKKKQPPRLLGKRLRAKRTMELPSWLIDLNLFTVGIFFLVFFGGVVGLYFLLRPDILLSFYQLLLLAAAFSGTLFWYLILGTEQGFDVATWKVFFKHGWLSFPLIFGIYFGFRLLFNVPLAIPFLQLLLIGFLIGLVFLIASFIIDWY
ncbi:hypothetical protein BKI52_29195 [marine bacterium AO1-C]|nr:hypothetical protein BKI52_29195 [marine bacterium AO1-C]